MTTSDRLHELLDLARDYFDAPNDAALARHLNVQQSTISRWRSGARMARQAEVLLEILNLLIPDELPVAETAT